MFAFLTVTKLRLFFDCGNCFKKSMIVAFCHFVGFFGPKVSNMWPKIGGLLTICNI